MIRACYFAFINYNLDNIFVLYKPIELKMADIKHGVAGGMAGIAVDILFYPL